MHAYFCPCPRGLEPLLGDEIRSLGGTQVEVVAGGVGFQGDLAACYRVNLESRLATRVLRRLAVGTYTREEHIYALALDQDWPAIFPVHRSIRVATTAHRSPLRSLDFVTLRVKDAICDRFRAKGGERPNVDTHDPDVRIHLYLSEEQATLYLDTSGAPLWQRGYRQAAGPAPLKENLAAGILLLSGWQPGEPLLDPMCGSGTLLIEAAMRAAGLPPGHLRDFALRGLNDFDGRLWHGIREATREAVRPIPAGTLFGGDVDQRAISATRRNLQALGITGLEKGVGLATGDILEQTAPVAGGGTLVANPPYGVRLSEQEALADLYPALGRMLKQQFAGWTACFFTADQRLPGLMGLKPKRRTPLFNGALECRLFVFDMVAGSHRRPNREADSPAG